MHQAGALLSNPVFRTEGRVTVIDGILAAAVLLGLVLNAFLGVVVCAAGRCPR